MYPPLRVQPKPKKENCKIKIKKTSKGKEIEFQGKCSKEELAVFKMENGIDEE